MQHLCVEGDSLIIQETGKFSYTRRKLLKSSNRQEINEIIVVQDGTIVNCFYRFLYSTRLKAVVSTVVGILGTELSTENWP